MDEASYDASALRLIQTYAGLHWPVWLESRFVLGILAYESRIPGQHFAEVGL